MHKGHVGTPDRLASLFERIAALDERLEAHLRDPLIDPATKERMAAAHAEWRNALAANVAAMEQVAALMRRTNAARDEAVDRAAPRLTALTGAVQAESVVDIESFAREVKAVARETGVGGALIVKRGTMLTALEGPGRSVNETLSWLLSHPRVGSTLELTNRLAGTRIFPQFFVGVVRPPSSIGLDDENDTWQRFLDSPRRWPEAAPEIDLLFHFWERTPKASTGDV